MNGLGFLDRIIINKYIKYKANGYWYTLKCAFCKRNFELRGYKVTEGKGKFCSKKCYGKSKIIHNYECLICNNHSKNKKYCSMKCMAIGYQNDGNPSWKGGKSRLPYHHSFRNKLKQEIRKRDNYTCQKCFKADLSSFDAHVHHLDGNKMNCDSKNLIIICRWCHGSMSAKGIYEI